jgi:hypothetical protein
MSKNNSPLKFMGGMISGAATSLSGGSNNLNNISQNVTGGLFGNSLTNFGNTGNIAAAALMARQQAQQAQQVPVNPGFNTDPNNIRSSGPSIVSEADMNRVEDRNSGSGVLTQAMHEMNSDMPMVKPMASKPAIKPNMGYSSVMSPFSPPELSTGNSLYGSELQKQEIMNPMPEANIDATGMNSLYGGPLSIDGGPKSFMGINPDHKGYCTPMTKPTCTPRRKALAKRLKPGGDLYKSKK